MVSSFKKLRPIPKKIHFFRLWKKIRGVFRCHKIKLEFGMNRICTGMSKFWDVSEHLYCYLPRTLMKRQNRIDERFRQIRSNEYSPDMAEMMISSANFWIIPPEYFWALKIFFSASIICLCDPVRNFNSCNRIFFFHQLKKTQPATLLFTDDEECLDELWDRGRRSASWNAVTCRPAKRTSHHNSACESMTRPGK